jgi:hypothetical protein
MCISARNRGDETSRDEAPDRGDTNREYQISGQGLKWTALRESMT